MPTILRNFAIQLEKNCVVSLSFALGPALRAGLALRARCLSQREGHKLQLGPNTVNAWQIGVYSETFLVSVKWYNISALYIYIDYCEKNLQFILLDSAHKQKIYKTKGINF